MEDGKKTSFREGFSKIWNNRFFSLLPVRYSLLAFAVTLFLESMNRLSFIQAIVFIGTRPHMFLYGMIMVLATLSLAIFFKKRVFVTMLITTLWGVLGIINAFVLAFRKTPLAAPDFLDFKEGMQVLPNYMNIFGIILLGLLVLAIVAGIVIFAIKSPKVTGKINYAKTIAFSAVTFLMIFLLTFVGRATGILAQNFGNIKEAYLDYGFNYCFASSLFNMGVSKPDNYSDDTVTDLVDDLESLDATASEESEGTDPATEETTGSSANAGDSGSDDSGNASGQNADEKTNDEKDTGNGNSVTGNDTDSSKENTEHPNIIFLQLESLFDPTLVKGLTFSEDPLPTLHSLYDNYSSGFLSVPSFGGGTANTEFEVISGMNLDDFGPGEYPYKTVLTTQVCESVVFYAKDNGYATAALHDNEGDFYARNEVFPQFGFDTFTSIEYIEDYDTMSTGWAKDECLIDQLTGIMGSTDTQDLIYTISVEGHGEYPTDLSEFENPITVTGDSEELSGNPEAFAYYVNLIHDMDDFVADLIDTLSDWDEDVILVMYGDHLPAFDFTNEELENGDIYQTRYVIWNNMGITQTDRDVEAYELSTLVLDEAGVEGNLIYKLHESYLTDESEDQELYLTNLKLLEYDILYGDCNAYNGQIPYEVTDMKMGWRDIVVDQAENTYTHVTITGEHFTKWSRVFINGEEYQTIYNGPNELLVDQVQLQEGDSIVIWQYSVENLPIGCNEAYIYRNRSQ